MGARKSDWKPIELGGLKMTSLKDRQSKVSMADFAHPAPSSKFVSAVHGFSALDTGRRRSSKGGLAISEAVRNEKTVILGMGAHPIKVGLNPVNHPCNRAGPSFGDRHERRRNHS